MNIIIFSKNRPAQLELLLRSIKKFCKEWEELSIFVLYMCENDNYYSGYRKVYEEFDTKLNYFKQPLDGSNFQKTLSNILQSCHKPYIALFCDDDVFIRPFSMKDKEFKRFEKDPDILCLNLRMDHNYNYCFDKDQYVSIPDFTDGCWEWRYYPLDWGFAMGTVGFIYRTKELKPLLERLEFTNPNTMEGQMAMNPLPQNKMLCYKKARTLNIPLNLVQNVALQNRAGNISTESLNKEFMEGKIISLNNILKRKHNSCFQIIKPVWVDKE